MPRRGEEKRGGGSADLEPLRPYLGLAREIQMQVERLAADDATSADELAAVIGALPDDQRAQVALAAFDRLLPDRQWEVVEAAFGDEQIRRYLTGEQEARRAIAARTGEARAAARRGRTERCLATDQLPLGHELSLGLFRPEDVHAGLTRGAASQVCARLLVLRTDAEADGPLQVLEDLFNPQHGLFVTADYDQSIWEKERLTGHAKVRVGSLVENDGDHRFEPLIYPGARVDIDVDNHIRVGTLLLGFAMVGDEDVFTAPN